MSEAKDVDRLKLLPCPFCGEPPREHYGEHSEEHWVACDSESCEVCPTTSGGSIESARRAWNRRQSLSQEAERDEVLEAACKLRCDFCKEGYPLTPKGRHHQVGDYQLPCKATDIRALKREPNAAAPELEVETEFSMKKSGPKYEFDIEGWPKSRMCSDPQECKRANRCLEIPPCGKFAAMTGASDD